MHPAKGEPLITLITWRGMAATKEDTVRMIEVRVTRRWLPVEEKRAKARRPPWVKCSRLPSSEMTESGKEERKSNESSEVKGVALNLKQSPEKIECGKEPILSDREQAKRQAQ
jgi:hypothetical protein